MIRVIPYGEEHLEPMIGIWNEVVTEGVAFPQTECLDKDDGRAFFKEQTCSCVAVDEDGTVLGLYILHPNNVGRCGHICNASYAVASAHRGRGIGERLVRDCLERSRDYGFTLLQFNAVVASNLRARRLYERLGFIPLGVIPRGFRLKDGRYEDICPYYIEL